MSTDTTTETDLDLFSSELFGHSKEPEPITNSEDPAKSDDNPDPVETPSTEPDDKSDTNVDTPEQDDDDNKEPEVKTQKKSSYQDRINELTAARREAERREADLQKRLDEIISRLPDNKKTTDEPVAKQDASAPDPNAVNADGSEKYPLGEFDPNYVADLTRHHFNKQMAEFEAKQAEVEKQRAVETARTALQSEWNEKIAPAQERYPDFAEKGAQLIDSFSDLDPNYSNYLADTIMGLDNGPDVLYYLSTNPTEAVAIVNSGATKATLALGRIDAQMGVRRDAEKTTESRPKVTKAPAPPPVMNKGASAANIDIPDDTDDLEAFASKLFKRK